MSNEYYTPSGSPTTNSDGSSATMRAEFASIQTGLDKLPVLAANGNKAVFVNAGGTALTPVTAATARTNLGLGTAATVNTGTSGATIPLLNAANTFSTTQTVAVVDAGAGALPGLTLTRDSASPLAGDNLLDIMFQGRRSDGSLYPYAYIRPTIVDPTLATFAAQISFITTVAGGFAFPMTIYSGVQVGSPTGGDKGAGTLNAVNLYVQNSAVLKQSDIFVSTDQTITLAGALTLAHGLGVAPRIYQLLMICQTAELGYSIGDILAYGAIHNIASIVPDATNLNVRYNSAIWTVPHKTTGVSTNITAANWKVRFQALK